MKSFTEVQTLLPKMAKVDSTDTTNVSLLMQYWNDSVRTMCNIRGGRWWFLETTETDLTEASTSAYPMPARIRKIMSLTVTVGTTVYTPKPIYDVDIWNSILASELGDSDVASFYYVQDNQILIQPAPSSAGNTITIKGRVNTRELEIDDYTTGNVLTMVNGSTAVVGTGTTWTAAMAGRYLRITHSDTANKGDGYWYEIASVTDATNLVLSAPYQGTAITAGAAAYTIGQMTPIPEAYDMAPLYRALALWNQVNDPLHPKVADGYWRLYDGGQEMGLNKAPGGLVGQMLENEGATVEGAYTSPMGSGPYGPPYYEPRQQASGF